MRKAVLAFAALALAAAGAHAQKKENRGKPKASPNPIVEMVIENRGTLNIELYKSEAPKTVARYLELVSQEFFDGIRFHRVLPHYIAQAGDPRSRQFKADQLAHMTEVQTQQAGLGSGGTGKPIPFEETKRANEPGTLAMALSSRRSATADSQFFINLVPNHGLDGDYCVFGRVVKGMDVVKKIRQGDAIVKMRLLSPRSTR